MKNILIIIFFVHQFFVVTTALNNSDIYKSLPSIYYTNSFFRQGWNFFAPKPRINSFNTELRCVSEDKVSNWLDLTTYLRESRSPFNYIFYSNNNDYIEEFTVGLVYFKSVTEESELCGVGDCSELSQSFNTGLMANSWHQLLKKICQEIDSKSIAGQGRITFKNLAYFSQKERTKDKYNDLLITDIYEF